MPRFSYILIALLLCLLHLQTSNATAAELSVPAKYPTIGAAIAAASPGDTVSVAPGLYTENIIISKHLVLISVAGYNETTIVAADPELSTVSVVGVDGAVLSGFTIKGSKLSGAHLVGTTKTRVTRNYFTENNNGLFLERSSGSFIEENLAEANEKGIYLYFSDDNQVLSNKANSNLFNGILLHASHRNSIKHNETNKNLWNGITLSSSDFNVVESNVSVKNTYAIVLGESNDNEIRDNRKMRRLSLILPVVLIYIAIMLYLVEKKGFQLYYRYKYGERE